MDLLATVSLFSSLSPPSEIVREPLFSTASKFLELSDSSFRTQTESNNPFDHLCPLSLIAAILFNPLLSSSIYVLPSSALQISTPKAGMLLIRMRRSL